MDTQTFILLVEVGVLAFMAGVILTLVARAIGRQVRLAPAAPPSPGANSDPAEFQSALDHVIGGYVETDTGALGVEHESLTWKSEQEAGDAEARFRRTAKEKLEPLLQQFVRSAQAHGHKAIYTQVVNSNRQEHRLEVERSDHPKGQPLPYLAIWCGTDDEVEVQHGGAFPAPADRNWLDTEVAWRTVPWDHVEREIVSFSKKVFRNPEA